MAKTAPWRLLSRLLPALLLLAGLTSGCATAGRPAGPATGPALRTWVEMGPAGALARAIVSTPGAGCPQLAAGGKSIPMSARAEPSADFAVLVCEAAIPPDAREARIGGTALPLPPRQIRKVAVLGDTGCRIKCNSAGADCDVQDCNDPAKWPFAQVARRIAAEKPDLVIHVGDYYYREAPCPAGDEEDCGGSPAGDNWPAWQADFFDPAVPLLAAAPWLFVRGNHEECQRGGPGWFRFLDSGPPPASCSDAPAPFAVALPGLQILVLNTSVAGDSSTSASFYEESFRTIDALARQSSSPSWLVMHHPLWAVSEWNGALQPDTEVLQQASGNVLAPQIELLLAGHIHLFEAVGFGEDAARPPGFVLGMGGTALDGAIDLPLVGQTLAGEPVASAATWDGFGYALVVPGEKGWELTLHGADGQVKKICRTAGAILGCGEPER
jgi:calcineurin-like phosphoesterase family protein